MQSPNWLIAARVLLLTFAMASTSGALAAQADELRKLDGEWVYVEDRTEGRALEQLGPPMSGKFGMRVGDGAVVLTRGHGSGHRDVRVALDGSVTELADAKATVRYKGGFKDGTFSYTVDFVQGEDTSPDRQIRRAFRVTADGLIVTAERGASTSPSVALYRHAEDIAMPAPHKATIGDLAWLAAAWVGTRSSGASLEERWSPPLGGAMLGVSRVVSRGRMSAFEFLRVVERDGGLVYVAQPGGNPPTEFVCTELSATRAVFDNPRHDYPKRITYELSAEGGLTATIGFLKGGTPGRFEYTREAK